MHRERCEEGEDSARACRDGAGAVPAREPGAGPGVWLRGNPRPGWLVGMVGVAVAAVLAAVLPGRVALPGPLAWGVAALPALIGAGVCLTTRWPRLVNGRGEVIVRLSPLRRERVPLDAVECFFLGSRLEPSADETVSAGDRVRTLVMRIAERAAAFAERPTLPAWGSWREGSVTFDGRWCEPLSVDLVRRLNRALAEAKRSGSAG